MTETMYDDVSYPGVIGGFDFCKVMQEFQQFECEVVNDGYSHTYTSPIEGWGGEYYARLIRHLAMLDGVIVAICFTTEDLAAFASWEFHNAEAKKLVVAAMDRISRRTDEFNRLRKLESDSIMIALNAKIEEALM